MKLTLEKKSNMQHICSKESPKFLCFSQYCKSVLCSECVSEHADHEESVIESAAVIKQFVTNNQKCFRFSEKLIADMKQTLILASRLFEFDFTYIDNITQLFVNYEHQMKSTTEGSDQHAKYLKDIHTFLLDSYSAQSTESAEVLLENTHLNLFLDPIKESFNTISKNYLEFYKKMRNFDLFKVTIKEADKKEGTKRVSQFSQGITEQTKRLIRDIQLGKNISDIANKYGISENTVSKKIKELNRNDEELKNFKYSKEFKQLNCLIEIDQIDGSTKRKRDMFSGQNMKRYEYSNEPAKRFKVDEDFSRISQSNQQSRTRFNQLIQGSSGNDSEDSGEVNDSGKSQENNSPVSKRVNNKSTSNFTNRNRLAIESGSSSDQEDLENPTRQSVNGFLQTGNKKGQNERLTQQSQLPIAKVEVTQTSLTGQIIRPATPSERIDIKISQTNQIFPLIYEGKPCIGVTYENRLKIVSLTAVTTTTTTKTGKKQSTLKKLEISDSCIHQENMIKEVKQIILSDMSSILLVQTIGNQLFLAESKTNFALTKLRSRVDVWDCVKEATRVCLYVKQLENILVFSHEILASEEVKKTAEPESPSICSIKQTTFLGLSKMNVFYVQGIRYICFLSNAFIQMLKWGGSSGNTNNSVYQTIATIEIMKVSIFRTHFKNNTSTENQIQENNILYALNENKTLVSVSSQSLSFQSYDLSEIDRGNAIIDMCTTFNSVLKKDFMVIAYAKSIKSISQDNSMTILADSKEPIQRIAAFWRNRTLVVCYKTRSNKLKNFHTIYHDI